MGQFYRCCQRNTKRGKWMKDPKGIYRPPHLTNLQGGQTKKNKHQTLQERGAITKDTLHKNNHSWKSSPLHKMEPGKILLNVAVN